MARSTYTPAPPVKGPIFGATGHFHRPRLTLAELLGGGLESRRDQPRLDAHEAAHGGAGQTSRSIEVELDDGLRSYDFGQFNDQVPVEGFGRDWGQLAQRGAPVSQRSPYGPAPVQRPAPRQLRPSEVGINDAWLETAGNPLDLLEYYSELAKLNATTGGLSILKEMKDADSNYERYRSEQMVPAYTNTQRGLSGVIVPSISFRDDPKQTAFFEMQVGVSGEKRIVGRRTVDGEVEWNIGQGWTRTRPLFYSGFYKPWFK